jgi:hypothetical protein
LKSLGHGKRFGKRVEIRETLISCNSCKSHCNQVWGRWLIVERRALSPRCRFINTELGKQYLVFFIAFISFSFGWLLLLGYPLLLLVALIVLPHTLVKELLVCFWIEFTTVPMLHIHISLTVNSTKKLTWYFFWHTSACWVRTRMEKHQFWSLNVQLVVIMVFNSRKNRK